MEVQGSPTTEGYVLQASQPQDSWKTISGTRLAISIQFIQMGENVSVMIGEGNWSDKIGAGALGLFVAWPLALSAGFGTYRQKQLPSEIFALIEKTIMLGGQSIVVSGAGVRIGPGQIACPNCKAVIAANSKFCLKCGAQISTSCQKCGAPIVQGAKFCNQCGQAL